MIKRWPFLASALFPLLCIGMWVRSLWRLDYVQWIDTRHFPGIVSNAGRIMFTYQFWPGGAGGNTIGWDAGSRPRPTAPRFWERPTDIDADTRYYLLGFECSPAAETRPKISGFVVYKWLPKTLVVAIPYWFLTVAAAGPGALLCWRHQRARAGYCVKCGYDLRATPERCPECGDEQIAAAGVKA